MEHSSQVSDGIPNPGVPPSRSGTLPDHWRLARAAHVDLLLMGMPRVNLLLIAPDGVVRFVIVAAARCGPIVRWRRERLALPPTEEAVR
jgi:hypothetical protein